MEPLKVMLWAYLEGGWFCEGKVGSGAIEGMMMKLFVWKIGVDGSKLPIRPPVLLSGKSVDEIGRTGGKGHCANSEGITDTASVVLIPVMQSGE